MEIGFVSFNQEALNRANKVMKLLQGQGAIDELGLGRIRDAFSNTMFPGLSVLQTHAKYFMLMPSLYAHLERKYISDTCEARKIVRDNEIKLTERLMKGSSKGTGIIGGDMLQRKEGYVKYDPTYVYQSGMETYGLIPRGGNIYATIVERSHILQNQPKKQAGNVDSGDDSDDLTGNHQAYKTCGENYNFDSRVPDHDPLDITLTHREAEFLKNQIIAHTQGSLLAYLLDNGLYEIASKPFFDELGEILENIPGKLYQTYRLALRYSRFALLLRLRYAMLYDLAVGATEAAEKKLSEFKDTLAEHQDDFTSNAINEIVMFVSTKVAEHTCKEFILNAATLIETQDFEGLDQLIAMREITIKGKKRSKLANAKEMIQGKPFESPAMMSFRWNTIVRTVLKEIKEGLER